MLRRQLARGLAGSPVCGGPPIRKALCLAYEVSALKRTLRTLAAPSKSPDRETSFAFETLLQPPNPFFKVVTSIAEKLLEKVLTFFCGFR
jgi:hypothetical protein